MPVASAPARASARAQCVRASACAGAARQNSLLRVTLAGRRVGVGAASVCTPASMRSCSDVMPPGEGRPAPDPALLAAPAVHGRGVRCVRAIARAECAPAHGAAPAKKVCMTHHTRAPLRGHARARAFATELQDSGVGCTLARERVHVPARSAQRRAARVARRAPRAVSRAAQSGAAHAGLWSTGGKALPPLLGFPRPRPHARRLAPRPVRCVARVALVASERVVKCTACTSDSISVMWRRGNWLANSREVARELRCWPSCRVESSRPRPGVHRHARVWSCQ